MQTPEVLHTGLPENRRVRRLHCIRNIPIMRVHNAKVC